MKLQYKGHSSEHVDQIVEECIEKGYLKEERYRDASIRRLLKRNRSDWYIRRQLEREGIAVSEEYIEEIRGELHLNRETQIQQLITKKMSLLSSGDPKSEEKILRYLSSRGYSHEQCREAWERFQQDFDNLSNAV